MSIRKTLQLGECTVNIDDSVSSTRTREQMQETSERVSGIILKYFRKKQGKEESGTDQ